MTILEIVFLVVFGFLMGIPVGFNLGEKFTIRQMKIMLDEYREKRDSNGS